MVFMQSQKFSKVTGSSNWRANSTTSQGDFTLETLSPQLILILLSCYSLHIKSSSFSSSQHHLLIELLSWEMNEWGLCLFLPLWKTVWKQWGLLLYNDHVFCLGRPSACFRLTSWLLWVSAAADCSPDGLERTPWDSTLGPAGWMLSIAPWEASWVLLLSLPLYRTISFMHRGVVSSCQAARKPIPASEQLRTEILLWTNMTSTGTWMNQNVCVFPYKDTLLKQQCIDCKETICSEKLRENLGHSRSVRLCTLT